jgi:hypothetical protein
VQKESQKGYQKGSQKGSQKAPKLYAVVPLSALTKTKTERSQRKKKSNPIDQNQPSLFAFWNKSRESQRQNAVE